MFDALDSGIELWSGEGDDGADLLCANDHAEDQRHVLPNDLEELPVGLFLAAIVSSVDPGKLNGHDTVRLMQARARLASHHEAGMLGAMAEVAFSPPSDPDSGVLRSSEEVEYAAVEVAAALNLTRRASESLLSLAVSLSARLRRVGDLFSRGGLDLARVRIFDQMLGHLPEGTVGEVLDRVWDEAPSSTTGQLRALLGRLVLALDPDGSRAGFHEGLAERRTVVSSNPDHTANFGVLSGHPEDVVAARDHVEHLARDLKTKDEPRTLDQLRADVALDLLQGKSLHRRAAVPGRTHITVSAETLAGIADAPGDLDGYGPVFAEIARKTVREHVDGEWRFTVTDQGRPVATGTLSRRPTRSQQRQVASQYPTCVWPGCRMPAHVCDLDHRRPHSQGGPTHNDNLGPLCRHHHMVRHHSPWRVRRTSDGDHLLTSPLGHKYLRKRGPPE